MSKTSRIFLAFTVILTVFLVHFFNDTINLLLGINADTINFYDGVFIQIAKYLLPTLAVLLIFHKPKLLIDELGLKNGFLIGFKFGFLITLPMLIGYAIMGKYNNENPLFENILRAFKDGFREEIFFRAFLFGQLFRYVKLGFLPAVAINGLIFGVLHIYQAENIAESIEIFLITFAGAIWFAWLFIEWKENLWIAIFLHFFMNFYWHIFSTENSALGGIWLNIPRIVTIALSIYFTIKMIKKRGVNLLNKRNLFYSKLGKI